MDKEKIWNKAKVLIQGTVNKIRERNIQWKKLAITSTTAIALGVLAFFYYQSGFSHEIRLNGSIVGYVKEVESVDMAMELVEKNVSDTYGKESYFKRDIKTERVRGHNDELIEVEGLARNMEARIQVRKPAVVIKVDGEEKAIVESKEVAEQIVEDIKKPYEKDEKDDGVKILDFFIKQDIEMEGKDVDVGSILNKKEALLVLGIVDENTEGYLVARQAAIGKVSRSLNSRLNRSQVEEVQSQDKEVEEEKLIDVIRVEEHKSSETIDFEEEERNDSSLYKGEKKVKQEGEKGKKEIFTKVTYKNGKETSREVSKEKVVKEAKNKIILKGTKNRPKPKPKPKPKPGPSRGGPAPRYNGEIGSAIVRTAKNYIGTPYRYGGSTPAGFDCSGFTSYVYRAYGISLPRTSYGQRSAGAHVSRSQLKPGDLVCFPGHVGIYVGNGQYIHSPQRGKTVTISSLSRRRDFISGRRPY